MKNTQISYNNRSKRNRIYIRIKKNTATALFALWNFNFIRILST